MGLFDKFKNLFNTKSKDETKEIKEEKEDLVSYEEGLEKTRNVFVNKLNLLNSKHKKVSEEYFEELEEILIMADIGVNTVMKFMDKLKDRVKSENITDTEYLKEVIVEARATSNIVTILFVFTVVMVVSSGETIIKRIGLACSNDLTGKLFFPLL